MTATAASTLTGAGQRLQPAVRRVLASRQVASATWALQEVAAGLLTDHLCHCVLNAARASDAGGEAALTEVATIRNVIRL